MTNETIVNMYPRPDPKNMERALELARADEREKCLKIISGKMFELQFMFNKVFEKTYQDRETLTLPELQQRIADIADVMQRIKGESEQQDEHEKMQGVEVWVSVDEDGTAKLSESELEFFEREKWGMFKYPERGFCVALPHQFGEFLKVEEGECAKFRIVRQP